MLNRRYRPTANNADQAMLFPKNLDSTTEFWANWEDEEVIAIQLAMIKQALNELNDHRRSEKMRKEAWDWLFSDEDHPFCSRLCASNNGLDIDCLRSLVRRLVKDL
ncbi:hypothetical protein AB4525_08235 [Vibrio breoganii]|uniref:Uncharacterized protein n=1 Tax=Vibrio breoganii TaxID=553239 RepID=A0AAP8SYB5_9VIBR|nr:hypothetical protein [Vibrio breoganii]PMK31604.1 hypothetical protein BCU03_06995 [Vibrio breoganii]PMK78572.1 hypothetical protein BCT94_05665 [Vibrio breoganii]PMP14087.1 hypothetical protein BCS93_04670 [Vibrio breoganii]